MSIFSNSLAFTKVLYSASACAARFSPPRLPFAKSRHADDKVSLALRCKPGLRPCNEQWGASERGEVSTKHSSEVLQRAKRKTYRVQSSSYQVLSPQCVYLLLQEENKRIEEEVEKQGRKKKKNRDRLLIPGCKRIFTCESCIYHLNWFHFIYVLFMNRHQVAQFPLFWNGILKNQRYYFSSFHKHAI